MVHLLIQMVLWNILRQVTYMINIDTSKMVLRRPKSRQLHDLYVISIPQELFGETVGRQSIRLVDNYFISSFYKMMDMKFI